LADLTDIQNTVGLWSLSDFRADMSLYLLSKATPQQISSDAQAECLKDEQVRAATATAVVSNGGRTITITIRIVAASGPFIFTLAVTQAATDLISLQAA
jgi:dihydroorotase